MFELFLSNENTYYFRSRYFVFLIFPFFSLPPSTDRVYPPWIFRLGIGHNIYKYSRAPMRLIDPSQWPPIPSFNTTGLPSQWIFTLPVDFPPRDE